MVIWRVVEIVFLSLIFLGWLFCMFDWIRGGCRIARWVHRIAFGCLLVGVAVACYLMSIGSPSVGTLMLWTFGPPVSVYAVWLWLFGPLWADKSR